MTTTITISDETLADLKLIKRAKNAGSMDEVIRQLMNLSGFNKKQLTYMRSILKEWGE